MAIVRWTDSETEADLGLVAGLVTGMWREIIPGEPAVSAADLAAQMGGIASYRNCLLGVLSQDDKTLGAALLVMDEIEGRERDGWVKLLVVDPAARRCGHGRELLRSLIEQARRAGRRRLTSHVPVTGPGGMFAASFRAHAGLVSRQNRVAVADLDRQLLSAWVQAGESAGGYSLLRIDGVCPDELLPSFTRLVAVMNTAPRSENTQDVAITGEQIQQSQEAFRRQGCEGWTLCARDDATGELVGFTELGRCPHQLWLANQGDTAVDPAHRGRGIGRWLKAANALCVIDQRTDITYFETWNADINQAMLSINDAMGYRTVAEWQEWELAI